MQWKHALFHRRPPMAQRPRVRWHSRRRLGGRGSPGGRGLSPRRRAALGTLTFHVDHMGLYVHFAMLHVLDLLENQAPRRRRNVSTVRFGLARRRPNLLRVLGRAVALLLARLRVWRIGLITACRETARRRLHRSRCVLALLALLDFAEIESKWIRLVVRLEHLAHQHGCARRDTKRERQPQSQRAWWHREMMAAWMGRHDGTYRGACLPGSRAN